MGKELVFNKRRHIVDSLDGVLSVFYVVSHFQCPSLFFLLARFKARPYLANPIASDRQWSLRVWFPFAILINSVPVLTHSLGNLSTSGAILDFVGQGSPVPRWRIVLLDVTILVLLCIQVYIAHEAVLAMCSPDTTHDPTMPPLSPSELESAVKPPQPDLVLDLSLSHLVGRLLHPPKMPPIPPDYDPANPPPGPTTVRIATLFTIDLPFEPEFDVFPRAPRPRFYRMRQPGPSQGRSAR